MIETVREAALQLHCKAMEICGEVSAEISPPKCTDKLAPLGKAPRVRRSLKSELDRASSLMPELDRACS